MALITIPAIARPLLRRAQATMPIIRPVNAHERPDARPYAGMNDVPSAVKARMKLKMESIRLAMLLPLLTGFLTGAVGCA